MTAILIFVFFSLAPGIPTPVDNNSAQLDSTFFVELNKDHADVVRQYIKKNQRLGLQKDTTVIMMIIADPYSNPDYHEIQIGGANSQDILRPKIPAYFSEVDGYTIAIYFNGYITSPGIRYPKSYLKEFERVVKKLRRKEISPYPIDHFEDWRVIYKKGEEPDIKILL